MVLDNTFNVVNIDGKNIIVDTTRNKFNDYYLEQLSDENANLSEQTKQKYEETIRKNNEKYQDSGFGVRDISEYQFRSNKNLGATITTM